ncbi:hypothetical protein SEPL_336 [Salmonella phage SE_PL]|uniref:hypothetical protein n=1 Tax=Salmonella enterica TaxID=28901 RepID=UPI000FDF8B96|nr:hypothetical protein CPT_Munch_087 [Salmonella phage Munch]EAZ2022884.1 hypothetical protein [Salmonella enterica]ECV9084018.1 hypothetical protein [Salmonella enterica subsp. enterica serovar Infantis]MCP0435881.1 hypothetical protein [Salmonella enterica subsp. enterica serovar Mbandaka]QCW18762.1 hypothetical protein 7t3_0241 [Salmonella phage 7t3]QIG62949.1 hypothetical protein SEPL_336 [Salmonella phage SE_PL]
MLSIKEICEYQERRFLEIHAIAEKIHPKLLRRINVLDLFNPEFDASTYNAKFKECIEPLIIEYKSKVKDMFSSHTRDFLEGWMLIHPDNHIGTDLSTGLHITQVPQFPFDDCDIMYDLEIEPYIITIEEKLNEYNIKPFWEMEYNTVYEGHRAWMSRSNNAEDYIRKNRNMFNGVKNTYDQLIEIANDINALPSVNLPPVSREISNMVHDSQLKNIVKHHKVLNQFFDKFGQDAVGEYYTSKDSKGNIKFNKI